MERIETDRLILRPWREEDLELFARLNADPRVMEYFPSTLSREESDELVQKISFKIEEQGWGLWAVSVSNVADFIGFIGLSVTSFTAEQNHRSISVMKRIGMRHDPSDDFNHPSLPKGNRLSRHVLHRIQAAEWKEGLNDH